MAEPVAASPLLTDPRDPAKRRILDNIESLGLANHVLELQVQGFTVLPKVLSNDRIERVKAAILRRVENQLGHPVDPETATSEDFHGMNYVPYLLFDDPVFPEILLEPKPLALVTYLLGEACVLSSMGSHFRGPGGIPLYVHSDSEADECLGPASLIANCNYALTPYSREEGALVLFPGSHLKARHPTAAENWMADGRSILEMMGPDMKPEDLEGLDWQLPSGGVTMEIEPGDCVVWHSNTWHGSWRRDAPGTRINLSAYFCREFMTTQELRGDTRYPEVFERYANEPRFAQLLGENRYNGWREDGPNYGRRAASRNEAANKS